MKDNLCPNCQGVKVRMVKGDRQCWCRFRYVNIDPKDNIYPISEAHPLESPENKEEKK